MKTTHRGGRPAAALVLGLAAPATAQTVPPTVNLAGRHAFSFSMGLLPQMSARASGVHTRGMLGGVSYAFWPASAWNIEVSGAMHDADASAGRASAISSLLFGFNCYPTRFAPAPTVRPYVGAAVGPYFASEAVGFSASAGTSSVVGGRVAGGVDAFPARWLRLGLRAGYHVTADFEQPVGDLRNASGAQFSLEMGVLFGGHRAHGQGSD